MLVLQVTERGFPYIEFRDTYGLLCSLQESSIATDHRVWLGCESNRMHLSREQVAELLPWLRRFVETGSLTLSEFESPVIEEV